MTLDLQQWLYQLLPAHVRSRDDAEGGPLAELLALIAGQMADLREDLDQRHDDLFIETCATWVVPYIGALVGHDGARGGPTELASPRAEVARTIGYRRRKGAVAVLPELGRDVSGWPTHVVEVLHQLAVTQNLDFPRPGQLQSPDLRAWQPLAYLGGPFTSAARSPDLRASAGNNLCDLRVHLWRLRPRPLRIDAAPVGDGRRFLCSPHLGGPLQLWSCPPAGEGPCDAPELVPGPIDRRELHERLAAYYGPGRSVALRVDGAPVAIGRIDVADLSSTPPDADAWARSARPGRVLLDPVLGRIALADPATRVELEIHHAAPAELGGGQAPRPAQGRPSADRVVRFGDDLDQILGQLAALPPGPPRILEIADSAIYTLTRTRLDLAPGARLIVRAAEREWPRLVLNTSLELVGAGADVELDGLLFVRGLLASPATGALARLALRDSTLVPGLRRLANGQPLADAPSIVLHGDTALELTRCVTGAIAAGPDVRAVVRGSVLDATSLALPAFAAPHFAPDVVPVPAPARPSPLPFGGTLDIAGSTVFGTVSATILDALDTIFHAQPLGSQPPLAVARRQTGSLRSCYAPASATAVPRRERCLPLDPQAPAPPAFVSQRFGAPGYAQLGRRCPPEFFTAAADGAELGAFHDLFHTHRERNLRERLDEHLRLGLRAGLVFVT